VRIQLFGDLRIRTSEGDLGPRDLPALKPKQLLELLVIERGHVVPKPRLAELLWGDDLPRNYSATIETYVSVLRRTLEPGVPASRSLIVTERGGYRLDATRIDVDLDEFDRLLQEAAGADPLVALAKINNALQLVRGQVLEDEPYSDWAEAERRIYATRLVQALIDAGRLSLLTGEATAALALAERAVALDPLAEAAYQVLMTAAYSLWRQDDALRAFDRCRRLLAEELGIDPLDETVALQLAILRHEDVASLMPRIPGRADSAPALGAREPLALLGREAELKELSAAVRSASAGRFTVVMVAGEPGIGKTTLVEAMTAQAGLPVGSNRCSDLEQNLPYLALALALRPLLNEGTDGGFPVLDDLLERVETDHTFDDVGRVRAMERLATALDGHAPAIIVLDDVHWADAETIRTLGYLRRRCATTPLLVVLTCERAGLKREELRSLRPDVRIDLDVLPPQALVPLNDIDLYEVTGGHPLFVGAWVAARSQGLTDVFPPEIKERILTRCWDLGPQAYRLLTVASALDQPVAPGLLATLVGTDLQGIAEELDRLVDERLITFTGQSFAFRHPPIRQILSETLSPARRLLLRQSGWRLGESLGRRFTDIKPEAAVTPPVVVRAV
jgi:DNA-binding SARP family transcriptional activator